MRVLSGVCERIEESRTYIYNKAKKERRKEGKKFTYEITYEGGYNVYGAGKGVIVRLATSAKNPQFTF